MYYLSFIYIPQKTSTLFNKVGYGVFGAASRYQKHHFTWTLKRSKKSHPKTKCSLTKPPRCRFLPGRKKVEMILSFRSKRLPELQTLAAQPYWYHSSIEYKICQNFRLPRSEERRVGERV